MNWDCDMAETLKKTKFKIQTPDGYDLKDDVLSRFDEEHGNDYKWNTWVSHRDQINREIERIKNELREGNHTKKYRSGRTKEELQQRIRDLNEEKLLKKQEFESLRNELKHIEESFKTITLNTKQYTDINYINKILKDISQEEIEAIKNTMFYSKSSRSVLNEYNRLKSEYWSKYLGSELVREIDEDGNFTNYFNINTTIRRRNSQKYWDSKIKTFIDDNRDITRKNNIYSLMMNNKDTRYTSDVKIGEVYMFMYSPKTKMKLSKYDMFPIVLIIGKKGNKLVGLNLHYVDSPNERINLLKECIDSNGKLTHESFEAKINLNVLSVINSDEFQQHEEFINNKVEGIILKYNEVVKSRNVIKEALKSSQLSKPALQGLKDDIERYNNDIEELKLELKDLQDIPKMKSRRMIGRVFNESYESVLTPSSNRMSLNLLDDNMHINKRAYDKWAVDRGCFKYYIFNEGNIIMNRFKYIPVVEYHFIVNIPPVWVENKYKKVR